MENSYQQNGNAWLYELRANPGKEIAHRLIAELQDFDAAYLEKTARKESGLKQDDPALVLAEFSASEDMEDTLIRWLQRITGELPGFEVTLNNYSGLPPHTVFLRVQDHTPFRELATQLKPIDYYVQSNQCPPVRFMQHPYVAIGRRLAAAVYDRAMADYAGRDFHGSFRVTELTLLRRRAGDPVSSRRAILRLQPSN